MNSIIDYALSFLLPGNDDDHECDERRGPPLPSSPLNKIVEARNEVGEIVYLEMPLDYNISHRRAAVQPCRVILS